MLRYFASAWNQANFPVKLKWDFGLLRFRLFTVEITEFYCQFFRKFSVKLKFFQKKNHFTVNWFDEKNAYHGSFSTMHNSILYFETTNSRKQHDWSLDKLLNSWYHEIFFGKSESVVFPHYCDARHIFVKTFCKIKLHFSCTI